MKRRKTIAVAAGTLATSAALLAGCGSVEALYGPPPATLIPTASFDPAVNFPATLYGPPEMFEPTFKPEDNIPEDLYGPPMDFEEEEELPEEEPALPGTEKNG